MNNVETETLNTTTNVTLDQSVNQTANAPLGNANDQNTLHDLPVPQDNDEGDIDPRMKAIIDFLKVGYNATLATRIVNVVGIAYGMSDEEIAKHTGCCSKTVHNVRVDMQEKGDISAVLTIKHGGGWECALEQTLSGTNGEADINLEEAILEMLDGGEFSTYKQIADKIKANWNIEVSEATVGRFLKKHGYRRLKSRSLPAKADVAKQKKFYEETLKDLMDRALAEEIILLFMDGAHFVFGTDYLGYIYSRKRRYVRTYSGRQRYNVLGAIDFRTKKVLKYTNDEYLNADSVMKLLEIIHDEYPEKEIHIILDNARYQKCKAVMDCAKSFGIELEFIPPYSPNLNLIERLWKFVKSELRNAFYSDFNDFKKVINDIISSTATTNRSKIDTLINKKVEFYDQLEQVSKNTYQLADAAQTQAG